MQCAVRRRVDRRFGHVGFRQHHVILAEGDVFMVRYLALPIGHVDKQILVRARRDPDNHEFFREFAPARRADLIVPVGTVVAFLGFASAVYLFPNETGLALAAIGFTVVSLGYRVTEGRRYWNISMGID